MGSKGIKLVDFAKQRNIARDTLTQYIRRHDELFKGHTSVDGKWVYLDEDAIKLLNSKYPLPSPIEIVEDLATIKELSATRKELVEAEKRIEDLQKQLLVASKQIAKAEAIELLLEDKQLQLEREMTRAEKAEKETEEIKIELIRLQDDLEKERAKSWVQKLFKI